MEQLTLVRARPSRIFHTLKRSGETVPIYYDPAEATRWRKGKSRKIRDAQRRAQAQWWQTYFGEASEAETAQLEKEAHGGFVIEAERPSAGY